MTLESVTVSRRTDAETRLTMVVDRVPAEVELLDANITHPGARPCGGIPSAGSRVGRESLRPPGAPLAWGERVTLGFGTGLSSFYGEPPRLDLVLQTSGKDVRCIPIPMEDDARPLHFVADQHLAIGTMLEVEGFTSRLGSVTQTVKFPVVIGAWLGDYRVEMVPALVVAGCPRDRCPPPSDGSSDSMSFSPGFSIALTVLVTVL